MRIPLSNSNRGESPLRYCATPRTQPAQVVFEQNDTRYGADGEIVESWMVRLLAPEVLDAAHVTRRPDRPPTYAVVRGHRVVAYIQHVTSADGTSRTHGVIQGGAVGSRRHIGARDVTEIQDRIVRWAGRRFRVEVPS